MRCLVTCGPTYESLDEVRRLTNFSTGKLGIGLANHLAAAGHEVSLWKGYYATCADPCSVTPATFTTTEDLLQRLQTASRESFDAIFHAAAVSDFAFGTVYRRDPTGKLEPITSGKFSTREGNLLVELIPTPKIIGQLRGLFPKARIFGWKYEVEGSRENVIVLGRKQIRESRTDFAIVNGPAYGDGFGIVTADHAVDHCEDHATLYRSLLKLAAG